ncbi:hypothetical protein [Vampirovibrio chlorellavorus]|uniref:hypothetical protein n=1 Tax=Vampirovibrio chlorellavorus TaxID=758823 RepID=UPI0026EA88F3|nr:hypothetical protein [Vampirovibrio chlorellavorus]
MRFTVGQALGFWPLVLFALIPGWKMASGHLSRAWLILLLTLWGVLGLCCVCGSPSDWAGGAGLWAVLGGWYYLQRRYAGQSGVLGLWACSAFTLLTLWLSFTTGLALMVALMGFSGLHCLLHEREERAVGYGVVPRRAVFSRWVRSWGMAWALPVLLGFWGGQFLPLDLNSAVWGWHGSSSSGHGVQVPWGYFSSFHQEFTALWGAVGGSASPGNRSGPIFVAILKSTGLLLIGLVPILGVLGGGYHIPGRFVYRLLQRPDEELLLFWLCALALIMATGGHSTSGAIVAHGFLAFLLAFWVGSFRSAKRGPLRWLGQGGQ